MKLTYSFIVLFIGGLFFVSNSATGVIKKDVMVFKVATTVFSLKDLENLSDEIKNLRCIYPEALILKIFEDEFGVSKDKFFVYQQPFSSEQKKYFKRLIEFAKLSIYSESQSVTVRPALIKALYTNARKRKCSLQNFKKGGEIKASFLELVRFEVFSRSRFLANDKGERLSKSDMNKAIIAAKSLSKSISRQVEAEVYWVE